MTSINDNLNKLHDYDIYLVDVYGVLKDGNGLIQGVDKRLENFVNAGKKIIILSNATLKSDTSIEKIKKLGLEKNKHFHEYITSGQIAYEMIKNGEVFKKEGYKKYCFWGYPRKDLFENSQYIETSIEEADFFYISSPWIKKEEYEKLPENFKKVSYPIKKGEIYVTTTVDPFMEEIKRYKNYNIPAFCANPDYIAKDKAYTGEEIFLLTQGSIAKAFKEIGGDVLEIGKPYNNIYEYAYKLLENKYNISKEKLKTKKIAMIGDTIRTDIQGAINSTNELGVKVDSFLTLTGVSAKDIDEAIIDRGNVAEIEKELNSDIMPTYIIKSFGE